MLSKWEMQVAEQYIFRNTIYLRMRSYVAQNPVTLNHTREWEVATSALGSMREELHFLYYIPLYCLFFKITISNGLK